MASFDDSYLVMQKEFDMLNASQEELQSRFDSLKPLLDSGDVSAVVGIGQELLPLLSRNTAISAAWSASFFCPMKGRSNSYRLPGMNSVI